MFKNVVVPLDRSSLAEEAIPVAASIARGARCGLDLVLVHQTSSVEGLLDEPGRSSAWKDEEAYLEGMASETRIGTGLAVTHAIVQGEPSEEICARAVDVGADIVVMASHGRTGLARALLGSVASDVVRRSSLPVLIIRPKGTAKDATPAGNFDRILVPLDGSAFSADIFGPASQVAQGHGSTLVLLRVVRPVSLAVPDLRAGLSQQPPIFDEIATAHLEDEAREQLHATEASLMKSGTSKVEAKVVIAEDPAEAIAAFAKTQRIDLIAMSTHGRGASRLFLGSVANKVLKASSLPVLVRRPSDMKEDLQVGDVDVERDLPALSQR